ncbi:ABC transporter substrate-binding protein [Gracilibacillus alcaliphilus]|uniref:ABC transporter substrate-binding protein n=1 Tax=Gracilibacillus alcaliphilus TaxID=1401441 RepID=UPI001EF93223|nr:ABC transporter substrate-binding protein [Gracilibacillus alcaliphilus]MBM7679613.1 peptide/nickel transport system substrate-binding protein [Gracilibacillus alcaliphilus]
MVKRMRWITMLLFMCLFLTACMNTPAEQVGETQETEENQAISDQELLELNAVNPEDIEVFSEAPELIELVESGEIPSVEERLPVPEDIMVEQIENSIGQYGGNLVTPWEGADSKWLIGKPTEEALFRFNEAGDDIEPNVAKGYEVNEDATEYIIYLREGMKWSDGEPFTTDDVLFYWEHMLQKETFGKSVYDAYYTIDPETNERHLAEITKIDDYTFRVVHAFPSPNFLKRVAIDNKWFFAPEHFHKTILPEFVGEDKALEIAQEWGFSDVNSFLQETGYYYWVYEEIPTLRAWVASNDPHSEEFVMKRNPYYWKVDPEGQQLPYTDNFIASKIQDPSQGVLGVLSGEFTIGHFSMTDFPVLKENEEKGGYQVFTWPTAQMASTTIQLNQTTQNDNLRELVQDIRFREALSIAVDRQQISEIVTNGIAEPGQAAVPEGLVGYQEGWAEKWTDYDPDQAEQLLDELGISEKNAEGFRLYEDDSVVTLTIMEPNQDNSEFLELIKDAYENVGVKVNLNYVDSGTFQDRKYSNQVEATTENPMITNVALRPEVLVPLRVLTPWQGNYGLHRETGGENGTEPQDDVAMLVENWDRLISSPNEEEASEWADKIYQLHMENQWILGYTGPMPQIVVAANHLHNVPQERIFADELRELGHGRPAQFYFSE